VGTKPVILLGAGASVDAGLPNAYDLTRVIYERLRIRDGQAARLFGFVVSKLLVRATRSGGSPFDKINVEEAYDTLKRLLNRESDLLGEFVTSWDPLIDLSNRHSSFSIQNDLAHAIRINSDLNKLPRLQINEGYLRSGLQKLLGIEQQSVDTRGILLEYVGVLASVLDPEDPDVGYLSGFVRNTANRIECIATLNYDLLVERSAAVAECNPDYGLTDWNTKRVIRFQQGCLKLLKLHYSSCQRSPQANQQESYAETSFGTRHAKFVRA
jgi:hypothetical protein